MIDEMPHHGDNGGNVPAVAGAVQAANQQQHAQVLINVQALQQAAVAQNHQQTTDAIASLRSWALSQFLTVNTNIRAFGGTIQGAITRQDPQQQTRRSQ
jgi:hypothetical protein